MSHRHPLARPLAGAAVALLAGAALAVVPSGAPPAGAAPAAGTLTTTRATSAAVGTIDYTVYLPPGYDDAGAYPTLYLLHGRGDTMAAWTQVAPQLDALIDEGAIPPMVVVMPDAPWSERGGYYVDSLADGGSAVETAFTTDLVDHVDATWATVEDRGARAVGGYSMGGAGALRYATAHPDLFSAGLVLSPAVYVPLPPADSSAREFGAYGVGDSLFDDARYTELAYPSTFASFDPALPVRLFIAVGDDEWVNPLPQDATHDLDYEAATLYNAAKRVPGVSSELRVYDGGHDWGVWARGFDEGMRDLGPRLRTTPQPAFPGTQTGSDGEDYAGGVLAMPDGGTITATNLAGSTADHAGAGGLDAVVQRRGADGAVTWTTAIAGPANDRAYGVVDDGDGGALVAGYSRAATDDMVLTRVSGSGKTLWTTTAGDPAAADRAYAVTADGGGGAYLAGYTSGSLPGHTSAGDKDAALVRVGADGSVLWTAQVGGPGEDKAYAVTVAADGTVVVAGSTTGAMPGGTAAGGLDAWAAGYSPSGELLWLHQLGTGAADQLQALVATPDGVVAAGYTGGTLPGATGGSAGGVDAMAVALGTDGTVRWQRQLGTAGDDRGAALVPGVDPASGGVTLVAHTDGAWSGAAGGVDVVVLPLAADGTPGEPTQLGSAQRDGADVYDEANLFASAGTDPGGTTGVWVQGITAGAVDGATNAGGTDVFLTFVALGDGATAPPTTAPPTTAPPGGGPEPTATGTGGALPPSSGGGGAGGSGGSGGAGGALGATGSDAARLLAAAAALTLAGGGLVLRRRRTRGVRLTAG